MRRRADPVRRRGTTGLWVLAFSVAGCDAVYLGVRIEDASGETRSAVLITEVTAGSPAATGGLEPNDVIVSFNLRGVTTLAELRQDLAEMSLGSAVGIKVFRSSSGGIVDVDITLVADANDVPTSLGVNVRTSTSPAGVEVVSVQDDSAADEAGMLANDLITKFGGTAIADVDGFRRALASASEGSTVTVTFRRGGPDEETTDVTIRFDVVSRLPILGIAAQDLSSQLAERLGYPALGGARVNSALIGGTAFEAGIMPRDVIFLYGDEQIKEISDLVSAVAQRGGSGTVRVGHARGGDLLMTDIQLQGPLSGQDYTLNVGLALVETLGGLLVVEVVDGNVAEQAGLQLDDVITAVEGQPTLTPQDFYRQLDAALDVRPRLTGVSVSTIHDGVVVSRFLTIRTSTGTATDGTDQTTTAKGIRFAL